MKQALPLTVIGGFLGAGKTTLLNHWLRNAAGQRLAVLVNDFGALNIDAELIEANSGDTVALTNGCVCCQIGDDLSAALIGVLESAARFDAVVIEASGVSDPWRIAQMGRADPGLTLDGVVVMVDASAVLAQATDRLLTDTLERQLQHADLVVLNKTDLVDAAALQRVRDWVAQIAPDAQQCAVQQADVPIALLSGRALLQQAAHATPAGVCGDGCGSPHGSASHHHAHGDMFETWSCQPQAVLSERLLREWLHAVPPGVLRLKGLVRTGATTWSELQFAGRAGTLRSTTLPVGGPALVAIGLRGQLPVAALQALVE